MKANLVAIKDCVVKAKTWNPVVEAKDETITYIDIAAVDKDLKKIDKNSIIFNNSVNLLKEEIIQDLFNMNNDISNFNKIKYTNKNLSLQDQEVYEFLICNSFLKYLKV